MNIEPIFYNCILHRPIPQRAGFFISSDGKSALTIRPKNGRGGYVNPRAVLFHDHGDGYLRFSAGGKRSEHGQSRTGVHVAVLSAWHRERAEGEVARHLDGDKLNNCISNLAWGTASENSSDMAKHGKMKGERNPHARMNPEFVAELRKERTQVPMWELTKRYPQYSKFALWAAVTGYTWGHLPGAVPQGRKCSKEGWKSGIILNHKQQ
jgi:hypothetical protein